MALFVGLIGITACEVTETATDTTSSGEATISGILNLPGSVTNKSYMVVIDADNNPGNGFVTSTGGTANGSTVNYFITNLSAGSYYVFAFIDVDSSGADLNIGDYWGYHNGGMGQPPSSPSVTVPASGTVF